MVSILDLTQETLYAALTDGAVFTAWWEGLAFYYRMQTPEGGEGPLQQVACGLDEVPDTARVRVLNRIAAQCQDGWTTFRVDRTPRLGDRVVRCQGGESGHWWIVCFLGEGDSDVE